MNQSYKYVSDHPRHFYFFFGRGEASLSLSLSLTNSFRYLSSSSTVTEKQGIKNTCLQSTRFIQIAALHAAQMPIENRPTHIGPNTSPILQLKIPIQSHSYLLSFLHCAACNALSRPGAWLEPTYKYRPSTWNIIHFPEYPAHFFYFFFFIDGHFVYHELCSIALVGHYYCYYFRATNEKLNEKFKSYFSSQ